MKDRIKRLRLRAGLTQEELAEAMGYERQSSVSMWETGERKVPSDKLLRLAHVLNCTVDELLSDSADAAESA